MLIKQQPKQQQFNCSELRFASPEFSLLLTHNGS